MVTIDRINSSYSVYYYATTSQYHGKCNECGGTDAGPSGSLATVVQAVIDLLEAGSGGSIFLKDLQIPGGITYGATILIIADYQGERAYYRNNAKLFSLEDLADLVVELP